MGGAQAYLAASGSRRRAGVDGRRESTGGGGAHKRAAAHGGVMFGGGMNRDRERRSLHSGWMERTVRARARNWEKRFEK